MPLIAITDIAFTALSRRAKDEGLDPADLVDALLRPLIDEDADVSVVAPAAVEVENTASRGVGSEHLGAKLSMLVEQYAAAYSRAEQAAAIAQRIGRQERERAEADAALAGQDAMVSNAKLMTAIDALATGTVRAVPDTRLPVCTWQRGVVEVRAVSSDNSRSVRVRYTPAQAVAAGAALIACAAVSNSNSVTQLPPILPPFPERVETGDFAAAGTRRSR
ncbi:hypothetical protein Ade02nite_23360 [Paractinoplanes deccanensis]|uniref:Uncharacterized protein n=1 Tax=Paractinoplanes deccanensis TaxID=113561 RepID=A0ABQ3Y1F8_9ACTN|nr:hypothetical protein [Actinoplanes deccanensis]GID73695.1 hypothetical protein Ade02nite_23360 [Actinoplanes deccanensis]